jgi:hypothetical protein
MHEPVLRNVRERLLREGVAPRHVNRYVTELRDHLTDLIERETKAGLAPTEARAKAMTVLGTESQLVQAMLDRGPRRSLAARAPGVVFGLLPILLMLALTISFGVLSMGWFDAYRDTPLADLPAGIRTLSVAVTVLGSYGFGLLLVLGCVVMAVRQRLTSAWLWAGLALLALACGAIGVHVDLLTTVNGPAGGIRGSFIQTALRDGNIHLGATAILMTVRTLGLLAFAAVSYRVLQKRFEGGVA